MNKSVTIVAVLMAAVLLSNGATARRLRTNPNRAKYTTTAAPAAISEDTPSAAIESSDRISVDPLDTAKFSFSDPAGDQFKKPIESDRKSFGLNSASTFSDAGTSTSSFGKGLRKRKPSYQISEESEEDLGGLGIGQDASSYEVNYKTTVTHKPGPSFDTGSYSFGSSVTSSPITKTKFGSQFASTFGSTFGSSTFGQNSGKTSGSSGVRTSSPSAHLGSSSSPSGIFKFNEGSSPSVHSANGPLTTKFAVSHPAPTHSAANLAGSYQSFSEESFEGGSKDKFIADYHSTLSKFKKQEKPEKPLFQNSPFKSRFPELPKFPDTNKFSESSRFPESTKFSETNQFSGSSRFPESTKFSETNKFSGSSRFPESTKFSESPKFPESTNFKVSSDFKVASETQFPTSTKTRFGGSEVSSYQNSNFQLQEVPNLYPSEETFRPSVGYPGSGASTENGDKLFEPNSSVGDEEFLQQQIAKNPASKGQYQQFLKSQEDEKIEQQALLEQLKYQQQEQHQFQKPQAPIKYQVHRPQVPYTAQSTKFSSASAKFRPYITVKKNYNRRKPLIRLPSSSPGLAHYRAPVHSGPYTISFSV